MAPLEAGFLTDTAGNPTGTSANPLVTTGSGGGGSSNVNLVQINGTTVLAGAGATGAGSQRVTVAQDTTTIAGSAPGTAGTASANVVTIQGIASMTAVTVAQATAANLNATVTGSGTAGTAATGVVTIQGIASMTAVTVTGTVTATPTTSTTATNFNQAGSASSVVLRPSGSRKGFSVYNDSSAILYVSLDGGTASTTNYTTQVGPQGFYELPGPIIYTGAISGIWASATGTGRITELT